MIPEIRKDRHGSDKPIPGFEEIVSPESLLETVANIQRGAMLEHRQYVEFNASGQRRLQGMFSENSIARNASSERYEELARRAAKSIHLLMPYSAILCAQYVPHAGGYTTDRRWSIGLSHSYLNEITHISGNVQSPVGKLLFSSRGIILLDLEKNSASLEPAWCTRFRKYGWNTLLALIDRHGSGEAEIITTAAFYNVSSRVSDDLGGIRSKIMRIISESFPPLKLDSMRNGELIFSFYHEQILSLLSQGKSNKEIARCLGKSPETIKHRIAEIRGRHNAVNRTELVGIYRALYSSDRQA